MKITKYKKIEGNFYDKNKDLTQIWILWTGIAKSM